MLSHWFRDFLTVLPLVISGIKELFTIHFPQGGSYSSPIGSNKEFLDALPLVHTFLSCSPIGHFWNKRSVHLSHSPERIILLSYWLTYILDALPFIHSFLSCSSIGYFWNEKGCSSYTFPREEVHTALPLDHRVLRCSPIGSLISELFSHWSFLE
jgi:hypothetical protein